MGAPGKLRKLWGLEDEDEFGAGAGWASEEQRIFDEAGRREALREEEKRDRMTNWEKYEHEGLPQECENEEEGEMPKYRSTEPRPSKREMEEHMLTHIPFRTWCPHCVRGKARATYHKKERAERQIPVISMDYMYMESAGSEDRGMPIMVAKDSESG